MKRILGGFLFVFMLISLTASVCFADLGGPRWPPVVSIMSLSK